MWIKQPESLALIKFVTLLKDLQLYPYLHLHLENRIFDTKLSTNIPLEIAANIREIRPCYNSGKL